MSKLLLVLASPKGLRVRIAKRLMVNRQSVLLAQSLLKLMTRVSFLMPSSRNLGTGLIKNTASKTFPIVE
jgi:hypothetical protein